MTKRNIYIAAISILAVLIGICFVPKLLQKREIQGIVATENPPSSINLGDVQGRQYLEIFPDRVESYGIMGVFFYDITMDGIPEVWLLTDQSEAERMVLVYSIREWGRELFRGGAGHSSFCQGNGYVLRSYGQMGEALGERIRWDGDKMVSDRVFEEHSVSEYTDPPEEPFVEFNPRDLNPDDILKYNPSI